MILTRENIMVVILALTVLFVFFIVSEKEVVLYAIVGAGVIYVIINMRKDKLVMYGER